MRPDQTLISDEQKRRAHLKLTYRTSQILAKLDSAPEIPNKLYTGKGLVSIDRVLDLLTGDGIHFNQDCPLPTVATKIHKPVTQQPKDISLCDKFLRALPSPNDPHPSTSAALEHLPSKSVEYDRQSSDDLQPLPSTSVVLDDLQSHSGDKSDPQPQRVSQNQPVMMIRMSQPTAGCQSNDPLIATP